MADPMRDALFSTAVRCIDTAFFTFSHAVVDNDPAGIEHFFYLWNPSITKIFAILVEMKRRFSDTYWAFESRGRPGTRGGRNGAGKAPPRWGGGGDVEGMKTARTQPRLASRYLGMAPSN